jgi:hypothetical protein
MSQSVNGKPPSTAQAVRSASAELGLTAMQGDIEDFISSKLPDVHPTPHYVSIVRGKMRQEQERARQGEEAEAEPGPEPEPTAQFAQLPPAPQPDPLAQLRLVRDVVAELGGFDRLAVLVEELKSVQV